MHTRTHPPSQFWSHVIHRKQFRSWHEYVKSNPPSWLHTKASADIDILQISPNGDVFQRVWSLIKAVWIAEGEATLANHFAKYYTENGKWKSFFLYTYDLENTSPNQQCIERSFLKIKGGVHNAPIINTNASFNNCVRIECRKLVTKLSSDLGGQHQRFIPMLEWSLNDFQQHKPDTIRLASQLTDVDVFEVSPTKKYVNRCEHVGSKICRNDVEKFEKALTGAYNPDAASTDPRHDLHQYRDEFSRFCVCVATVDPFKSTYPRRTYWRGSCPYYQRHGQCAHSFRVDPRFESAAKEFIPSGHGKERKQQKSRHRDGQRALAPSRKRAARVVGGTRGTRAAAPLPSTLAAVGATTMAAAPLPTTMAAAPLPSMQAPLPGTSGVAFLLHDEYGYAQPSFDGGGSHRLPAGTIVKVRTIGQNILVTTIFPLTTLWLKDANALKVLDPNQTRKLASLEAAGVKVFNITQLQDGFEVQVI